MVLKRKPKRNKNIHSKRKRIEHNFKLILNVFIPKRIRFFTLL